MSCVCSYGYDEGDYDCTFWRERSIGKTRKEHKCYECGDTIPVGSRCCTAFSITSEHGSTMYRCLTCAVLAELIAELNKSCPLWGGLRETCEDNEIDWYEWRAKAGNA